MMTVKNLQRLAATIWMLVGCMLIRRALLFFRAAVQEQAVATENIVVAVFLGLLLGYAKGRYVLGKSALFNKRRIQALKGPLRPWNVFAPKFYLLIMCMMALGFVLRRLAAVGPGALTAVGGIYLGIGIALFISAFAYKFEKPFDPPNTWLVEPGPPVPGKIGILLTNLGTPTDPSPGAVGRFLREFLWDPRVVDVPRPLWWFVLNVLIVPLRKHTSAALYRRVFTAEGSPLRTFGLAQAEKLQSALGLDLPVKLGVRFGKPSIADSLAELKGQGCERIVVLSAYPQYSATTTASIYDAVTDEARRYRHVPSLRFQPPYPEDERYISALADRAKEINSTLEEIDHVLFSFHGIPTRYADRGDPYPRDCVRTATALAGALDLQPGRWTLTYQSQFGTDPWLAPATDEVLTDLAANGVKHVMVFCPGYLVDCLETIDEIGKVSRDLFRSAGGEELTLVPCLSDHPVWIEALVHLARRELAGWINSRDH